VIGDDVDDLELLSKAGISACPPNANPRIKKLNKILLLKTRGGDGAVREMADMILEARGIMVESLFGSGIQ